MIDGNLAYKIDLYDEEMRFFTPPADITISQHAALYRVVTEGEHRGPWVNENFAYLVEPMDTYQLPHVRSIVLCFAPQTGKTQIALNCLAWAADQSPGPAMYIMPTENKARDFSKGKLTALYNDSPHFALLKSPRSEDWSTSNITLASGMNIKIVWANSPSALSSESEQYVFFDECDKYEEFSGNEADPLTLGEVRTIAYPNTKKIMYFSTPNKESGAITRVFTTKADDVRDYYAKCPSCGHEQVLVFEQIKWPKHIRDPRTMKNGDYARYECESCLFPWNDYVRNTAVRNGRWKSRNEVTVLRPRTVAFHLPAWYSRNVTLSECAAAFLEGLEDRSKKMAFITQYKADPWKDVVKTSTKSEILKARCDLPPQTVPASAVALTCGIDVQKYGYWFVVRAFARDYRSWLIHYGQMATEDEVEKFIFETSYPIEDSDKRMHLWRVALDTGGGESDLSVSLTEKTYFWLVRNVRKAASRGIGLYGTKGASRSMSEIFKSGEPLLQSPSGKQLPKWLRLMLIDTGRMKDNYHYHIQQAIEGNSQGAYLYDAKDEEYRTYIRHILAEEKRTDRKGIEQWIRVNRDNHLFDCEILALSLADYRWPLGGVNIYDPPRRTAHAPEPQRIVDRPDMASIRERLVNRRR